MRRGSQRASLAFLALSAVWMVQALAFPLKDPLGPGPGFFPFWLPALRPGDQNLSRAGATAGFPAQLDADVAGAI